MPSSIPGPNGPPWREPSSSIPAAQSSEINVSIWSPWLVIPPSIPSHRDGTRVFTPFGFP